MRIEITYNELIRMRNYFSELNEWHVNAHVKYWSATNYAMLSLFIDPFEIVRRSVAPVALRDFREKHKLQLDIPLIAISPRHVEDIGFSRCAEGIGLFERDLDFLRRFGLFMED